MEIPLYFYFNLASIIIWLSVRTRLKESLLNKVGILISVSFFIEFGALIYSYSLRTSNHWIYNVYTTGQIISILYIYSKAIVNTHISKRIVFLAIIFFFLVIANLLLFQSFFRFHTYTYIIGCFLIFYTSIEYLRQLLHQENWIPLKRRPFFWITIGNIIYFVCSMFYLGSVNYILDKNLDEYGNLINLFVYLFTSVQFIFYSIAFLCNLDQKLS